MKQKLTKTMIEQLLSYAEAAEKEGWYYGPEKEFKNRHGKIMEWLKDQLEALGNETRLLR